MGSQNFVAIGYHPIEARFALHLAAELRNRGVNVWMDRLDIAPDDDWQSSLEAALRDCRALIPVLSPDYVYAPFGQYELDTVTKTMRPVIPALLRHVHAADWPSVVGYRDYIDFTEWQDPTQYAVAVDELIERIRQVDGMSISSFVIPEKRYLTSLETRIEILKSTLEFARISYQARQDVDPARLRPRPRVEASWGMNGPFILRDEPLSGARYLPDLHTIMEDYPCLVLVGESGSGKTTALHRMVMEDIRAYRADPRHAPLPVLANLSEWDAEVPLQDFLQANWMSKTDLMTWLHDGTARLYLDGLDEMTHDSTAQIDTLYRWIHGDTAPQSVVIACDVNHYDESVNLSLPVVSLEELTDTQVRDLITLYLGERDARDLLHRLLPGRAERDDAVVINALLRKPLLLRLVIFVYLHSPDAPILPTPALLIQRYVELVWEREQILQNPDWIPYEHILSRLASLAFDGILSGRRASLPLERVVDYIGTPRLVHALHSAGILMTTASQEVRFVHGMIQATIAALRLWTGNAHQHLSRPVFTEDGRRYARPLDTTIIALTGLLPAADAYVSEIADVDPCLALTCIASGSPVTDMTRRRAIARLVYFTVIEEPDGLPAAVLSLEKLSDGNILPPILELMRRGEGDTRRMTHQFLLSIDLPVAPEVIDVLNLWRFNMDDSIAIALHNTGNEAIPPLLRLLTDMSWTKRRAAAWALGQLGDRAAVIGLIAALRDMEIAVRREAALALRHLRDVEALPRLLLTLRDADLSVRQAAATALAEMGASAVPGLLRMMQDDRIDVRRVAIGVLGRTGDSSAVTPLIRVLADSDPDIRAMAVTSLGNLRHAAAIPELTDMLTDTAVPRWSDRSIAQMAVQSLSQIGTEEALSILNQWRGKKTQSAPAIGSASKAKATLQTVTTAERRAPSLKKMLRGAKHDDWRIRRRAIELLSESGDPQALPVILRAIEDADNQVRWQAVKALDHFEGAEVMNALFKSLHDGDYLVSDTAAEILGRRGSEAVEGLMKATKASNPDVRGLAIEALGRIQDNRAIPALSDALSDSAVPRWEDKTIGTIAAESLEAIGTPTAQAALVYWHRQQQITTPPTELGATILRPELDVIAPSSVETAPDQLQRLLQQLRHDDWQTRQQAARQLNQYARAQRGIQNPDVTERIVAMLRDADASVRFAAVEALAWIHDPACVPALMDRLEDRSWTVRVAAVRALAELNHESALPGLMTSLKDQHELVREVAAEVLGKMNNETAVPALIEALADSAGFVRRAAVESLGVLGSEDAVPWLIALLAEDDYQIRWTAAEALGKIGAPEAVEALAQHLDDLYMPPWQQESDRRLCDVVANALEQIGTSEAQSVLAGWQKSS